VIVLSAREIEIIAGEVCERPSSISDQPGNHPDPPVRGRGDQVAPDPAAEDHLDSEVRQERDAFQPPAGYDMHL
jgi:hypothetical protein